MDNLKNPVYKKLEKEALKLRAGFRFLKNNKRRKFKISTNTYKLFFQNSLNAIAYHKIITNKKGKPVDYLFIEVNDTFEEFTGLKGENIIGKNVTEIIPDIENDKAGWIEKYGEVALLGKELKFEQFSEYLQKWYKVSAYSPEKGYFITEFRDVTAEKEKQKIEDSLRLEKKRFNDLFETIPAYLILLTPDYKIPFANRFFRNRFGDPLGRRCYEYLFDRTEPCEVCDTYKTLRTMLPQEWEWTGPDKRVYLIHDYPFIDVDGSTLILEMGIDITELKKAQEELRIINESLERRVKVRTSELREKVADFDLTQSVAQIGSWRLKFLKNELIWSDETYRIFEVKKGTYLTYDKFLSFIHPDDREYVISQWNASLTGQQYNIEHRIVVNGKIKWVSEKAILEYEGENLACSFGTVQDITERKLAEEKINKLSLAVEQNPASIVITDKNGNIEYINPIFSKVTGYTLEEAIGKNPRILKSGVTPEPVYKELWETIQSGNNWNGVLCNKKKNGDLYWESVLISPILNEKGNITHFVSVKENITERKRMEDELIKKNAELTKINELLEDFVYITAHDLRSPIANIKATCEFIEFTEDVDKKMLLLKNLVPIVNKLEKTIDGLVETINIQKNNNIIFKKLKLGKIYNEVINNLTHEIKKYDADLTFDFEDDLSIEYVEAYLMSIFTNLIHNALKYSSKTRKTAIHISAEISGEFFLISFEDNGIGMDMDSVGKDLFKLFNRFTNKAGGNGMGLYIIKNIIEKNGGFIKVESKINEGTTIHCYLKEYSK